MEIQMTAHRIKNQHMRKFVTWAHVPLESLGHGSSQSGLNIALKTVEQVFRPGRFTVQDLE
jgi:hypothetical protein